MQTKDIVEKIISENADLTTLDAKTICEHLDFDLLNEQTSQPDQESEIILQIKVMNQLI